MDILGVESHALWTRVIFGHVLPSDEDPAALDVLAMDRLYRKMGWRGDPDPDWMAHVSGLGCRDPFDDDAKPFQWKPVQVRRLLWFRWLYAQGRATDE